MNTFENILEYLPNNLKLQIEKCNFVEQLSSSLPPECKKYIVSLSGGVDSMVLISILKYLNLDVIAIHINYNNRCEAHHEQLFLQQWCGLNQIKLYIKEIKHINRESSSNRSLYEEETTKIRFDFYKYVLNKEKCESILLGHHKDDIVENIFTNVCRGRNILDLKVIQECSIIDNVKIRRPLIKIKKTEIYDFAKRNNIPYFLDSTPLWSVRGKCRNRVFKELSDTFGKKIYNNLFEIGEQSNQWSSIISKSIVEPFLSNIVYSPNKISINIEGYEEYPFCFWNTIFMKVFHKQNLKCPSKKSILNFMKYITNCSENNVCYMNKESKCILTNETIDIYFDIFS